MAHPVDHGQYARDSWVALQPAQEAQHGLQRMVKQQQADAVDDNGNGRSRSAHARTATGVGTSTSNGASAAAAAVRVRAEDIGACWALLQQQLLQLTKGRDSHPTCTQHTHTVIIQAGKTQDLAISSGNQLSPGTRLPIDLHTHACLFKPACLRVKTSAAILATVLPAAPWIKQCPALPMT